MEKGSRRKRGLNAVPDGMTEIEDLSKALLVLVLLDDDLFQKDGFLNDGIKIARDITFQKQREQVGIEREGHLQGLGEAVSNLSRREC